MEKVTRGRETSSGNVKSGIQRGREVLVAGTFYFHCDFEKQNVFINIFLIEVPTSLPNSVHTYLFSLIAWPETMFGVRYCGCKKY